MNQPTPGLSRRLLRIPVEIVVFIFVVVDAIVSPLFRPIMRALSSLQLIKRIEQWIGTINPYVILVLLGVPFAIAEVTKVVGVFLMSEGHYHSGMTLFIGAYIVSILVCERIFAAGRGQLMKIRWFAVAFTWLMGIKDKVLGWFRATRVWQSFVRLRESVVNALRPFAERARSAFGMKPRRVFER